MKDQNVSAAKDYSEEAQEVFDKFIKEVGVEKALEESEDFANEWSDDAATVFYQNGEVSIYFHDQEDEEPYYYYYQMGKFVRDF